MPCAAVTVRSTLAYGHDAGSAFVAEALGGDAAEFCASFEQPSAIAHIGNQSLAAE